jgi:hypothetical protein
MTGIVIGVNMVKANTSVTHAAEAREDKDRYLFHT